MSGTITYGTSSPSSGGGGVAIQDWYLPPVEPVQSSINSNSTANVFINYSGTIKDFSSTSFDNSHTNFILRLTVVQDVNSPGLLVLQSGMAGNDVNINEGEPLDFTQLFNLSAVTILPVGVYVSLLRFSVYATNNVTNQEDLLEVRDVPVELQRVGDQLSSISRRNLDLVYLKNSGPLNTESVNVVAARVNNEADWLVTEVSELDISVTNGNPIGQNTIAVSLDQVLSVAANSVLNTYIAGVYQRVIPIQFIDSNEFLGIEVTIRSFDGPGIITDKDSLVFQSLLPDTAVAQILEISATGAFTVVGPAWLILSENTGNPHKAISIQPVDVANFSGGTYQGDIIITHGAVTKTISVTHIVLDQLSGTMNLDGYNFTKDQGTIVYSGYNSDHYLEVHYFGVAYDQDGLEIPVSQVFVVPFVNNKATFIPGNTIDRLIPEITSVENILDDIEYQAIELNRYSRAARLNFSLKVINKITGDIVVERDILNTTWVRGIIPKVSLPFVQGFLSYQKDLVRLDSEGFFISNFFTTVPSTVHVYVNGTLNGSLAFAGGDSPSARAVLYGKDYLPGDTIELVMEFDDNGITVKRSQTVVIYPKQRRSCHIIYATTYNTYEAIQLTGAVAATLGINRRTNVLLKNDVEVAHHVDVLGTEEITINTGYIPRDMVYQIAKLNMAKRAWLIYPGLDPIELSNTTSEMKTFDSEQFLYDYEVTCKINRKNNAEVHTF